MSERNKNDQYFECAASEQAYSINSGQYICGCNLDVDVIHPIPDGSCKRAIPIITAIAICTGCKARDHCKDATGIMGYHNPNSVNCLLIRAESLTGKEMFDAVHNLVADNENYECYSVYDAGHSENCENCQKECTKHADENDSWMDCPIVRGWIKEIFVSHVKEAIDTLAMIQQALAKEA